MARIKDNLLLSNLYNIYGVTLLIIGLLSISTYILIQKYVPGQDTAALYLLASFLFILGLFSVGVIYPSLSRIKHIIKELEVSEYTATTLATELSGLNKEVKDINFALMEGTIMIKTDAQGKIFEANPKYCQITKYERDELVGKMLFENNLGGDESIIYAHIRDEKKCKEVWRGEIFDHAKDGTPFWLDVTLIPVVSSDGLLYEYMTICSDITPRKKAEQELKVLNEDQIRDRKIVARAIISGQELERKRMSQEIHDGVGQMLTGLKFGLESINGNGPEEVKRLENIKMQLQDVIREIRRISSDLRPAVLTDFGVIPAIKDLVKTVNTTSTIPVFYNDETNKELKFHKAIEVGLYRVVQESINNALKHAAANQIVVTLSNDDTYFSMSIEDDGQGFNLDEKLKDNTYKISGNGLASMRQRAELMGGELSIESTKEDGTLVSLKVPIETVSEFYETNLLRNL